MRNCVNFTQEDAPKQRLLLLRQKFGIDLRPLRQPLAKPNIDVGGCGGPDVLLAPWTQRLRHGVRRAEARLHEAISASENVSLAWLSDDGTELSTKETDGSSSEEAAVLSIS